MSTFFGERVGIFYYLKLSCIRNVERPAQLYLKKKPSKKWFSYSIVTAE